MSKYQLLVVSLLFSLPLFAQQTTPTERMPTFRWGISGAMELQFIGIEVLNVADRYNPPVRADRQAFGGGVGIFGRWQLARALSIQPELYVARYQQNIQFRGEGLPNATETYQFTDLELPLHFIITNQSAHFPLRASFLFGGRVSWNIAQQTSSNMVLLQERIGLDVGLGIELTLGNLALQPELLYSHGLNNIHNFNNTPYDPYIGNVVRDKLQLRVLVIFD